MGLNDFLEYEFLQYAVVVITCLSLLTGVLSPIIIAKKYAFMGASVSHSSLLGVALALSFTTPENSFLLFSITLFTTLLATAFLAYSSYKEKVPNDTLIGIFYTSSMGAGMLIHNLWGKQNGDLLSFLFGNILLIGKTDLYILMILTLLILFLFFKLFHPLALYFYDEQAARIQGLPVAYYHFGLYFILTLVIVSSVKIAGTILINSLLLVPGFFALKFAQNLKQTFLYSILFSFFSSMLLLVLSNTFNLPVGPALGVGQFLILVLLILGKKIRGL